MNQIISKTNFSITIEREESISTGLLFVLGGFAFIVFSILFPTENYYEWFLKLLLFVFGVTFGLAAYYVPKIQNLISPKKITVDFDSGIVKLEMNNLNKAIIPFHDIIDFEISSEKRSPSAANSRGINYIHYHINIKRKDGSSWTIASSTKTNEANQLLQELKERFSQTHCELFWCELRLSSQFKIEKGNPINIYYKKNRISISDTEIEFLEKGKVQKRLIKNFKNVIYSYSGAIKNTNATIRLIFFTEEKQNPETITLLFGSLNPVELLHVENWLSAEMNKRKSALEIVG